MLLGIDGGQTKTVGMLLSLDGEIVAQKRTAPMPHCGELTPDYFVILRTLVKDLCEETSITRDEIYYLCGGLCGIDSEAQALEKEVLMSEQLQIKNITLVNDAVTALWGATDAEHAIILQHGTAFTSAIRDGYDNTYVFDSTDIGCIYDIREELIKLVARMIDGREETTPLKEATLKRFKVEDETTYGYNIEYELVSKREQKNTVDFIFDMWEQGDAGAAKLIENAARDYAAILHVMLRRVSASTVDVVFGGGVLDRAPEKFLELCKAYTKTDSEFRIVRPQNSPVMGAALLASELCGKSKKFSLEQYA